MVLIIILISLDCAERNVGVSLSRAESISFFHCSYFFLLLTKNIILKDCMQQYKQLLVLAPTNMVESGRLTSHACMGPIHRSSSHFFANNKLTNIASLAGKLAWCKPARNTT